MNTTPKTIKTLLLALSAVFIAAINVHACEFHGGFGGSGWSPYGPMSPHNAMSKPTLVLESPRMIKATPGEKAQLTVKFTYSADEERPVVLLLNGGPSVSVVDKSSVNVEGKTGEHTFTIVPETVGTYRLLVSAGVEGEARFPLSRRVIYLSVST